MPRFKGVTYRIPKRRIYMPFSQLTRIVYFLPRIFRISPKTSRNSSEFSKRPAQQAGAIQNFPNVCRNGAGTSEISRHPPQHAGAFRNFPNTRRNLQEHFGIFQTSAATARAIRNFPIIRCKL